MIYQISELQKFGQGCSKIVYQHPEDDNKIIKIMNPEFVGEDGGWQDHTFKRNLSNGVFKQFQRQILEYLKLCKVHYQANQFEFPVETPYGFAMTSQGLGLVTEKILSPNGKGMTLHEMCQQNLFEDKHAKALADFYDACCDLHIVFGEVNINGIMYTESRNNKPEFVLVDGIGEKLFIPLRKMSKRINAWNIRKMQNRINAEMQIILDSHKK